LGLLRAVRAAAGPVLETWECPYTNTSARRAATGLKPWCTDRRTPCALPAGARTSSGSCRRSRWAVRQAPRAKPARCARPRAAARREGPEGS